MCVCAHLFALLHDLSNVSFYNLSHAFTHGLRTPREEMHGRKLNPNPKFLGTAEAYLECHVGPIFQVSLINAFIGCS